MKMLIAALAATMALTCLGGEAAAQPYPSRPVRIVVPYAPGGAGDVIARIVSQQLAHDLGVSVVVENKPGGGGMIGAQAVASAPADGYTLLLGNTTEMVVSPYLVKAPPYETQRDFRPVALAGYLPQLLIANPGVQARTLAEFIALAKANPGKYSYATAGTGSTAHIAGEGNYIFNSRAAFGGLLRHGQRLSVFQRLLPGDDHDCIRVLVDGEP